MKTLEKTLILSAILLAPLSAAHADWKYYGGNRGRGQYINQHFNDYSPRYNSNFNGHRCGTEQPRPHNSGYYNDNYNAFGYTQIRQGIRGGQLSPREVRELKDELSEIREKERYYYSDGHYSKDERDSIREGYEDFRHDLKHELKDGERRWR